MKNKYIPTAAGLYLNYLIHGMGVLLITLNMAHLQEQWGTDKAGVSIVISSLGIGKLATIVTGFLSDRFGRKPFIYLGILSYLIFSSFLLAHFFLFSGFNLLGLFFFEYQFFVNIMM